MGDPHNTDEAGRSQTATGIRALSAAAIPEGLEYLRAGLERRHEVGRQLIGLTVKDAREVATRSRCTLRLVRFNGKGLIVTADLGLNRIDVSVEDGIVVDAH